MKTCPRCNEKVSDQKAQCPTCHFPFPMSCEGCGRETKGRVFCRECSEQGFQKSQPLQSEQKNAEKFINNVLKGR